MSYSPLYGPIKSSEKQTSRLNWSNRSSNHSLAHTIIFFLHCWKSLKESTHVGITWLNLPACSVLKRCRIARFAGLTRDNNSAIHFWLYKSCSVTVNYSQAYLCKADKITDWFVATVQLLGECNLSFHRSEEYRITTDIIELLGNFDPAMKNHLKKQCRVRKGVFSI